MTSYTPDQIQDLIMTYISAGGKTMRRVRQDLKAAPSDLVVPILIEMASQARKRRVFERTTGLLAEMDDAEAIAVLIQQAYQQRRYPRLAIRALAKSRSPQVVPALVELLESRSQKKQSAAAATLVRRDLARSVEQYALVRDRRSRAFFDLRRELRNMGSVESLGIKLLQQADLSVADRVRALRVLPMLSIPFMPFNVQRFLDRVANDSFSPIGAEARACASLLHAQNTLGRPTEHRGDETLLRAASGPGAEDEGTLLRAAEAPNTTMNGQPDPEQAEPVWWRRVWQTLRRGIG